MNDNSEVEARLPLTSPMPPPVISPSWATTASGSSDSAPRSQADTIPFPGFLADFEFINVQGQGGMGVVFGAREKATDRVVAIKVVQSEKLADPRMIQRFAREARASIQLEHAHIVPVYDVIQGPDKSLAIVSRFLPHTLSRLLENNQLTLGTAIKMIVDVASALDYVHREKKVHRDVKPANILIDGNNDAFLADFGLVSNTQNESCDITAQGQLLGTPAYMAPEQCTGTNEADYRADIYALGVTLLETITGQKAFSGPVLSTLEAVRNGSLRNKITHFIKRCPWLKNKKRATLIAILQKCTALKPQDRYQSATKFGEALAGYLSSIGDAKDVLIHPKQIAVDEVTSRLSSMSSIMEVITERRKTSLLVVFLLLIVGVAIWWFQFKPSTIAEPQLPVIVQPKVKGKDVSQTATKQEKPSAKSKFLLFSDDKAMALTQLKDELKKQIKDFKDDDFSLVTESQTLHLKLIGYEKKQVESFLLKLSESKGTHPWQTADIMLAPDVERPKAFVEWAKAHSVFVY